MSIHYNDYIREQTPELWNILLQSSRDFTSDNDAFNKQFSEQDYNRVNNEGDFPLPYMVYLTLISLLEFRCWGKEEKIAWTIPFKYKENRFLISHRKLGLRIFAHSSVIIEDIKKMIVRLNKTIKVTDKLMEPFIEHQLKLGNTAITNKYHSFYERYLFFREKAREAFDSLPPPSVPIYDSNGKKIGVSSKPFQPIREGMNYTQAMLDSYFSYLEHLLVLLLPFQDFSHDKDDLARLMSSDWTTKYNRIFKPQDNPVFMKHYKNLKEIKEKYRNTFAHGGFEKQGASLFVQIPYIGYIPVTLSNHSKSISFSMFPVRDTDYSQICNLFDEFEKHLNVGDYRRKMEIIKSGLDIYFESDIIEEYNTALESDENLKEFLDYQGYLYDRNANMEW